MINLFPKISMNNKTTLSLSNKVGCYHCCKIFYSKEVKSYTDNNKTAICPYCNVDCLVGDNCGFDLNENIIKKANLSWFGGEQCT